MSTPAEQTNKAQRQNAKVSSPGCRRRRRRSCVSKIAAHRSGFSIVSRSLRNIASIVDLSSQILHDQAATSALLWRVRVLALWHNSPYGDHHVISSAVAVGNDAIRRALCQRVMLLRDVRSVDSYLLLAWLTGMRSLSRSSRRRLLSSVRRRSFRSAMLCLFFLICVGSPTSREVY